MDLRRRIYGKRKISKKSKTTPISKDQLRTRLLQKLGNKSLKKEEDRQISYFKETCSAIDLTCSICMELILRPFTLPCGHVFCFACLDDLSQYDTYCNSCPCCRASIGEQYPMRSAHVEGLLDHYVRTKLSEQQRKEYITRNQKQLKKYQDRSLDQRQIYVGGKIDVRVGNKWQVGTIKKIFDQEGKKKIEVMTGNSKEVYVFNLESTHIARFLTFAKENKFDFFESFSFSAYLQEFSQIIEEQNQNEASTPYRSILTGRNARQTSLFTVEEIDFQTPNQRVTFFEPDYINNEDQDLSLYLI